MSTAPEAFVGQFIYRYEGGNVFRVISTAEGAMQWECIDGPAKGAKGEEQPQRFEITDKIYYVTWAEMAGACVSQVVDFAGMKMVSTIIKGTDRYVREGKIVREK